MLQGCGRKGALFMEVPKSTTVVKTQVIQPVADVQSQPVSAPNIKNQSEIKK